MRKPPPEDEDTEEDALEDARPAVNVHESLETLLALAESHPTLPTTLATDSSDESKPDGRHCPPDSVHADKNSLLMRIAGIGDCRIRWREIHKSKEKLELARVFFRLLELDVVVRDDGGENDTVTITVSCCKFPLKYWESREVNDGFRAWKIVVTKCKRTSWLLTSSYHADGYFG